MSKFNSRVVLLAGLFLLMVAIGMLAGHYAGAQSTNRAGLVIRFGDGHSETTCVNFVETSITGYDLLRRSGQPISADLSNGIGAAICKIGADGCDFPAQDCFCKFNSEQSYWSYWTFSEGAWAFQNTGASGVAVRDGDIQGWSWARGTQTGPAANKPPVFSLDQICAAPLATQTRTVTPSATRTLAPPPPIIGGGGVPLPTATIAIAMSPTKANTAIAPTSAATSTPTIVFSPTPGVTTTREISVGPTQATNPTGTSKPPPTPTAPYADTTQAMARIPASPLALTVRRIASLTPLPSLTPIPEIQQPMQTVVLETASLKVSVTIIQQASATPTVAAPEPAPGNMPNSYVIFGAMTAILVGTAGYLWRKR